MKNLCILLGMTLFALSTLGNTKETKCQPNSYAELVKCAEKSSFDIQISEQRVQAAVKLEDAASQFINPDLEANHTQKGTEKSETTATLLFTLRTGGKKSALVNEARAGYKKTQAERDFSVGEARLNLMLSFYRLIHLKSEIEIEDETIGTFSKIIRQFQSRAGRNPEQDVSLSVFTMAIEDHKVRLMQMKTEQERIFREIEVATDIPRATVEKNLPPIKNSWPEVQSVANLEDSPQMRLAQAETQLAKSLKEKAEGDSWPDIRIGPSIRTTVNDQERDTFVGVGLSMPLPVLTFNGGQRAVHQQRLLEAEMNLNQSRKRTDSERTLLVEQYNQIKQTLKSSLSLKALTEKHQLIERQFFRGLVSSALVIEAHRQFIDSAVRRNSSEIQALDAYGKILILDNKFNEAIL